MREIENHHWNSVVVITASKVINECYNEGTKLQGEREHFHSLRISPTKYCCCGLMYVYKYFIIPPQGHGIPSL